jgi:hypothetical protein
MNDFTASPAPNKLIPVMIGALAMTATTVIPILNLVNCLCCAGIMGGAVLGVWFYKKNFPPDRPFTVGNGALIGTLSGLIAGALTSIIEFLQTGMLTGGSSESFNLQLDEVFRQMESQGQDPAAIEQARQFIEMLFGSPVMLFVIILVGSLLVFAGFGALGGVIGGNIFKTRYLQVPPQAPPQIPMT